jgi:hypothetical protein
VSADWYERAIDGVARSAREVSDALQAWNEDLTDAHRQRVLGVPLFEMVRSGIAHGSRDRRLAADEAIADYRAAVMRLRVAVVRNLVNTEGMTLTAVAKLFKVSRQMASRLYATAQDGIPDRE